MRGTFKPFYVLDRRGGVKHLVTALNRNDYMDSVRYVKLSEEVSKTDLKKAEKDAIKAAKTPRLTGREKRQERLTRARRRAEANKPTRPGEPVDITEIDPDAAAKAKKIAEKKAAEADAKKAAKKKAADKKKPTKEQRAAARKAAADKRKAAREESKKREKEAAEAAAAAAE